ncbi:AAA family ATPase [Paucibacter sp. O1-1]|nr:AAA family ATPase [Paucibacter sp. O1-1]MDA3824621.1 AAA family ATPase [Paucibacter sp. O1-1]
MSPEHEQLRSAIQALEAQRGLLGDAVVDMAVAPLKAQLAARLEPVPPAEAAQTLRQVSILFLDVVGSTTLSHRLDPEAISAVMDDALARGTVIVEAHHGKVLQYAGDSILAAFGAEESHEDDTERAVHCGLALLELGKQLGAEVESAHGHAGFNVRVGVHTGSVLLGGGVDGDASIRGIAVNIAARMEQTAPAGALRISHDSYAQVRGLFDVQAQAPLMVKGVDRPIQSYLVKSAKPRNFRVGTRGIEGVATRMVGRDTELQALQAAFKRLFADRRLAAVTVVAEAGVGKSRLQHEFEAWSEEQPERFHLFRGRATPQTGLQAYGLLRDLLAWRFQIRDDDSVEVARQKMEDGVVPLFLHDDGADLAEAHAHLLGHLIGIEWQDSRHIQGIAEDPKQIRNRAFHAAAQVFRRLSASDGSPVVLQLTDLHWADDETLDFLDHLADVNRDVPLLMLTFTRPTLFERRTGGRSSDGHHQRIDLRPLDLPTSRLLAEELLKKLPGIPMELSELLVGRAEGNPFYMEELLRMLIDQSAIRTGETWAIDAERLLSTQVPSTLTGVLQARLDSLPGPEKHALQQASVVGAVFWDQALAAVEAEAAQQLPALARRALTLPRADAVLEGLRADLREYAFRHQLLHQVTYDTVLKRARREGHAKVAQWLALLTERGGLRAGDLQGLAAEHFEQAGDAARAAEFHARAAEQAGQRFAHERVLAHVGRALALLGQVPPATTAGAELHWRLLSVREKTLGLQARRAEQATDLDALAQLAETLDDNRRRAHAARRRSLRAMRMADWTAGETAARQAMACAAAAGDDGPRLHALRLLAWARVKQLDFEGGRSLALQGLAEARSLGLRDVEAPILNVLAIAAATQGDMLGYLAATRQSLQIYRETGDRVNETIGLSNLGVGWLNLGDLAQAQRDLSAALQLLRADGNRVVEGTTLCMLGVVALWQGDAAGALVLAGAARDIAVAAQARDEEILATLQMAAAELALSHVTAARAYYAQARQRALEIDHPLQQEASAGLARVALAEGDTAGALAALQPVLDHVAAGGSLDHIDERQVELSCHQALARAGDPRADHWLVRAHGALMAQADAISRNSTDTTLRQGFLQNIPHHREIVAAWAQRDVGSEAPAGPAG